MVLWLDLGSMVKPDRAAYFIPRRYRFSDADGLLVLYESDDEFLGVGGVNVDVDFAFASQPAEGGERFLVFEFGDFLELLQAQGFSGVECCPNGAGVLADSFYIHDL